MINLTKLYFGNESISDDLRYGRAHIPYAQRKPVVVWTMSRRCNLRCLHCYTGSEDRQYKGELSTDEGYALLDDLAKFKIPALLMSGGEPLYRPDFDLLAKRATDNGLRVTLSTNGILITEEKAELLKKIGVTYIGISLDGKPEIHDEFRQKKGAYDGAVRGIRHCRKIGLKVGLRLTLTRHTRESLDWLFDVIDEEGIERVCFYHLVYSGRGRSIEGTDLSHAESRDTLDLIIKKSGARLDKGRKIEVLTVDQSCDGPYLALKMFAEGREERARDLMTMLAKNGGGAAGSGVGICNIDPCGGVHPDQFWQADLGNIRDKPFSEIWTDGKSDLLNDLRNRLDLLNGRCSDCAFKKECGGSFRARAVAVHSDPWMEDPACYLNKEEIRHGLREKV